MSQREQRLWTSRPIGSRRFWHSRQNGVDVLRVDVLGVDVLKLDVMALSQLNFNQINIESTSFWMIECTKKKKAANLVNDRAFKIVKFVSTGIVFYCCK